MNFTEHFWKPLHQSQQVTLPGVLNLYLMYKALDIANKEKKIILWWVIHNGIKYRLLLIVELSTHTKVYIWSSYKDLRKMNPFLAWNNIRTIAFAFPLPLCQNATGRGSQIHISTLHCIRHHVYVYILK